MRWAPAGPRWWRPCIRASCCGAAPTRRWPGPISAGPGPQARRPVRAGRDATIGEFDFLLDAGADGVEHIEFATKLYLLQGGVHGDIGASFDSFVGPNLADSLGRKMRKVFDRQLQLGSHPAAQEFLPR